MPIDSALDLVVMLVFAPGFSKKEDEPIRDTTRLVKLLYLLVREGGFEKFAEEFGFEPHDFGPWSSEVYDQIETLNQIGILSTKESPKEFIDEGSVDDKEWARQFPELTLPVDDQTKVYSLTEKGRKIGRKLYESLSENERWRIESYKSKFNNMPLLRLLWYVYNKYPEAITKSKIKERVLRKSMFGTSPDLPKFEREEDDFRDVHECRPDT